MESVLKAYVQFDQWMRRSDFISEQFAKCPDDIDCYSPGKVVLISFLFHFLCYFLSGPISSLVFSSYNKLTNKSEKGNWDSRVVSTIHALVAVQGSYRAMFHDPIFKKPEYVMLHSPLMGFYLAWSLGYFIYDFILIHVHPTIWDLPTFVHHSLAIVSVTFCLRWGQAEYFIGFFLFTEITTPFINQRWFFSHSMRDSTAYLVNGLIITLGWFAVRVFYMCYIVVIIYLEYEHGFSKMDIAMQLMSYPSLLLAWVLNIYWGYLIGKGFLSAVLGVGGGKPKPAAKNAKAAPAKSKTK